jgi:hypothetical protein
MLVLAIIFALTGAALGLRFKALVLVPASGFAVAGPFLTNFAYCYSPPVQALATITTVMALQIGYLLSIAIQLKLWTSERPRAIEGTSVGAFGLIEDDVKDHLDA